jgi:hypothetical protein
LSELKYFLSLAVVLMALVNSGEELIAMAVAVELAG